MRINRIKPSVRNKYKADLVEVKEKIRQLNAALKRHERSGFIYKKLSEELLKETRKAAALEKLISNK